MSANLQVNIMLQHLNLPEIPTGNLTTKTPYFTDVYWLNAVVIPTNRTNDNAQKQQRDRAVTNHQIFIIQKVAGNKLDLNFWQGQNQQRYYAGYQNSYFADAMLSAYGYPTQQKSCTPYDPQYIQPNTQSKTKHYSTGETDYSSENSQEFMQHGILH